MHIVVVCSGQDFIALTQRQAVIQQSQTGCRVLGKRDISRVSANVVGDSAADLQWDVLVSLLENRAIDGKQGVRIYPRPVLLNRRAHSSRVRGKKEQGEMNIIGSKFKLPAH